MLTIYSQNVWNENPCAYRNKLIRSMILDCNADICMFQECGPRTNRTGAAPLPDLLSDTYSEVCPDFSSVNFTPVFYKTASFTPVDCGYELYTGLNDANSKSITWAVLESKAHSKKLAVASTHLWWKAESENDNRQRLENVKQLKNLCDSISLKHNVPIIIGGDFNNGINSEQGTAPYKAMLDCGFSDIRLTAKVTTDLFTHHDYPTLTGDETYINGPLPVRNLDYIFTYGDIPVSAGKFEILTSQTALDSSDHCPLTGYFSF